MLAHGIRSYHRPGRLDEAVRLAAQGVVPLAGGTRLLARAAELANVLDLKALGLAGLTLREGDLVIGAMTPLQDVIDSASAYEASGGLLPEACRAHSPSRMLRGMATLGGEAIHGAPDSDLVAALLALNAVFHVESAEGSTEIPAMRFVRRPAEDLAGGGILTEILIPGPAVPGTALERAAALPSAPTLVSAAVTIAFAGDRCTRARIALTGLRGRPSRVPEAETKLENTPADARALERCLAEVTKHAQFRGDAHAPESYRRAAGIVLVERALVLAIARARAGAVAAPARLRPVPRRHAPVTTTPYFTSGRIEVTLNGRTLRPEVEARTSLLGLLRRLGCFGVKHGCETGECGACTVLLGGRAILACLTLAVRAHGRSIDTVEGLGRPDELHPIQRAFVDTGAIQCGYCTPAMELCAKSLLDAVDDPSDAEVRDALAGCLCRCTGYVKPVAAVQQAAAELRAAKSRT
jgi:aerobic-type carbon monoxide dehydrogenase small subunit (CoxS/CutS family)/CO/xanthine dehydrogenase FAD-binding subunit